MSNRGDSGWDTFVSYVWKRRILSCEIVDTLFVAIVVMDMSSIYYHRTRHRIGEPSMSKKQCPALYVVYLTDCWRERKVAMANLGDSEVEMSFISELLDFHKQLSLHEGNLSRLAATTKYYKNPNMFNRGSIKHRTTPTCIALPAARYTCVVVMFCTTW